MLKLESKREGNRQQKFGFFWRLRSLGAKPDSVRTANKPIGGEAESPVYKGTNSMAGTQIQPRGRGPYTVAEA